MDGPDLEGKMATITGTNNNDSLTGGAANDIINGLAGADTMAGGLGNDVYYVDTPLDVVKENANQGTDTVNSTAVQYQLADNIERLFLSTGAIFGYGNDQANIILGNDLNNGINGRGGADFMMGGKGNDVYNVDNVGDKVVEFAGQGTDAIHSTISYSIAALGNVENLNLLFGASTAIKATGNALSNMIGGNEFENIIDGGAGADIMGGWTGNDTYLVDNIGDQIVEYSWEGASDSVISSVALKNAFANVENYDFSKVAVAVDFTADTADNVIKSGLAIDKLTGGAGNDTYYINSTKDVIVEQSGGGTDTVASGNLSIDLSKYAFVENAMLVGAGAFNLTGTAGLNHLTGNDGANTLRSMGGGDVMAGRKGNDRYYIYDGSDQVVETKGEGVDTVFSYVNHTLADNVEKLVLLGSAEVATGNELNNILVGNDEDNVLNGAEGADFMRGGEGDDEFYVDNAGDKIYELAGQGHDAVRTSVDFSLAPFAAVENLILEAGAHKGTGNALANLIVGNDDWNYLNGGIGADTMKGGDGFDTYYVDNVGDKVTELFGQGWDTVRSTVALSQGFANVEDYDFSKATSAVNFTGTNDGNQIWGSAFTDTLIGGLGNDRYYVNNTTDKVVELNGQGTDTIISSVSLTKLAGNVENLGLKAGSAALIAIGNDLDNQVWGNEKNNILKGGIGDDTLTGDRGNDTLTGGEGHDTFAFWYSGSGGILSGHDVITDFDSEDDILQFGMIGDSNNNGTFGELEDLVAGITDQGAGQDVVLQLMNGGSITFKGIGTGSIDSITDLVADPATQLIHN